MLVQTHTEGAGGGWGGGGVTSGVADVGHPVGRGVVHEARPHGGRRDVRRRIGLVALGHHYSVCGCHLGIL